MKKTLFTLIFLQLAACHLVHAITTVSPDQPSMDYLEPEAQAVGINRTWLLAIKNDPIVREAAKKNPLATPQEGKDLWLEAANQQARLGKAEETRYCLYKRLTFMEQLSAIPFMWAFFIDLGERIQTARNATMPSNPLSIAIANNKIDFVETVMPKEAITITQLSAPMQIAICYALMGLTLQAIQSGSIPVTSTLIDRIKKYNIWDHPIVQQLRPLLMRATNDPAMKQALHNTEIITGTKA